MAEDVISEDEFEGEFGALLETFKRQALGTYRENPFFASEILSLHGDNSKQAQVEDICD